MNLDELAPFLLICHIVTFPHEVELDILQYSLCYVSLFVEDRNSYKFVILKVAGDFAK